MNTSKDEIRIDINFLSEWGWHAEVLVFLVIL